MINRNNDEFLHLDKYLDPRLDEKIITLPLQFEYLPVQIISKQYTKLNSNHPYRIHYLGPRFTNTLVLHKKYSGTCNYKQKHYFEDLLKYNKYEVQMRKIMQSNYLNQKLQNNHFYKSSIFYRAFEGMNPTLELKDQYLFNSCFESGNLDCVIKVTQTEYDLFLRIDSNTRGHTQWFYFSVQNGNKTGKVTFNLCNLTKPKTLYQQGMRPYVYSKKKFQKCGREWEQDGENLELVEKRLRYNLVYQMLESLCVFKLSFEYNFTEQDDEVFFAYSIPYTYSQMLKDIQILPNSIVKKSVLGRTLTGVEIPILHITNHEINKKKKNVMIIGRTHPGESNGSHVLKGFINMLCSNSQEATELRNKINFIIVPMANPDGVIMGNSRSSASGKDLNRQYLSAKKQLYPQVFYIKNLAFKLQKNQGVFMFFDFHGHSRKKNTFFYGPAYGISEPDYYKSRALAKLIEKINNSFRYYSCSFMISEEKKGTARAIMFQKIKIPYVYTIQSSIGLYYDPIKMKTIQFTKPDWEKMGNDICLGVSQFLIAYEEYEQILTERRKQRQKRKQKILKRNLKDKKFAEDAIFQQDEANNIASSKKVGIMFELMQQIKQLPPAQKLADAEASSDDHDDGQDLELSKLKQFNNLVIQSKQKDQLLRASKDKVGQQTMQQSIIQKKVQTENDELQIMKQVIQLKKNKHLKNIKSNSIFSSGTQQNLDHKPFINVAGQRRFTSLHRNATINLRTDEKGKQQSKDSFKQFRKTVNFQTHKHLISKQFFPVDRCQIVDLPKSSISMRKDVKKGRVMMEQYLKEKRNQKQMQVPSQKTVPKIEPKTQVKKVIGEEKADMSSQSLKKFKIQDIIQNRALSQNRINQKRMLSFKGPSSQSNRIFDSVLFSGFQGMQIDNMAMMIRTFNK